MDKFLNTDPKNLEEFLTNTKYKNENDILKTTEYRDTLNAERLYNGLERTNPYVMKRANDESDFWKGGKYAYGNEKMKEELIKSTSRNDFIENKIPEEFEKKEHNMRVTRISEYSNALFNNNVFKNPRFTSC